MRPALLLLAAAAAFAQPHTGYVFPAGGRQGTTFEVTVGGQALSGVHAAYLTGDGAQVRVLDYERPMTPAQAAALREEAQSASGPRLVEIREKLARFQRRPMNPAIAETVRLEVTLDAGAVPGRRELRLGTPGGITNPLVFHVGTLPESLGRADIELPAVVNGQILPGAVDRYRFHAAKGQRLAIQASARDLIPYISDAVPGWFQATLTLRDPEAREVQYAEHDPLLRYVVPVDGMYTLEVRDAIYRGREDFVYRVAISEAPLAGPARPPARTPRKLKLGATVAGCIDRPGRHDVYRFDGKKGEAIVAEIRARRDGSPLDSFLRLLDAKGREVAANDDTKDDASALLTHHADSYLAVMLPANGTYALQVGDSQKKGGPDFTYRLRFSRPQPDFELRVAPSGINVRGGAAAPVLVEAIRRDGFDGEIALSLEGAPAGFRLDGGLIPAGQSRIRVTLTAPLGPSADPIPLSMEGRASIGGREVRHPAVPADDMMQAFYYHHLVPASDLLVRVIGPPRPPVQWRPISVQPIRLPAGGETTLQIRAPLQRLGGALLIALNEPPDGITVERVTPGANSVAVVLRVDSAKVKAGLKGNLILDAFVERPMPNAKQPGTRRKQPLGSLPAVPFEVVAR